MAKGTKLGEAYIKITASTTGMQKQVTSALGGMGKVGDKAGTELGKAMGSSVEKQLTSSSVGARLTTGLQKAMKTGALSVGTAVGGTIATGIAKGMGRLNAIEGAQAKLSGLGNNAATVAAVMDNALAAVKGTAHGMGEAASTAASMVAAGIKPGQELEQVLKTVADTASIAGRQMDDVGLIFGSIAARGKLQGDDMLQLMSSGIPVLQLLAKQTGKTSAEISDMVSKGEIDFATFEKAMRAGVGGAALDAGKTLKGSMDNLGAAVGRAGAAFLEPGFKQAPGLIGKLTDKVDSLTPALKTAGIVASDLFNDVAAVIGPLTGDVAGLARNLSGLAGPVAAVAAVFAARKFTILPEVFQAAGGQAKKLNSALFDMSAGAGVLQHHFAQAGREVSSFDAHMMVASTSSNKFLSEVAGGFVRAKAPMNDFIQRHSDAAKSAADMALRSKDAFTSVDYMGQQMAHGFAASVGKMTGTARGFVGGALGGIKTGLGGLVGFLGGPWGAAFTVAGLALGALAQKQLEAKVAAAEHKQAQQDLKATLDNTTGAITDQTRALAEQKLQDSGAMDTATRIGLSRGTMTSATMGDPAAIREVEAAVRAETQAVIEGTEFWAKNRGVLEQHGFTVQDLTAAYQGNAEQRQRLQKISDEEGNTFGMALHAKFVGMTTDVDRATKDLASFSESFTGVQSAMVDASKNKASELANTWQKAADDTKAALNILGETKLKLVDEKTISFTYDPATSDQAINDLKAMGLEVEKCANGTVSVSFPNGADVYALLKSMGMELDKLADGRLAINTDDAATALAVLEEMGIKAQQIDGHIVMDVNDQETIERLQALGLASMIDGNLVINDNIGSVEERRAKLEKDTAAMQGNLKVNHNIDEARSSAAGLKNDLDNVKSKTVDVRIREWREYYSSGRTTSTSGTSVGQHYGATGGRFDPSGGFERLPRYAVGGTHRGYRLPSTGPGTHKTDGFLAKDQLTGAPTAWLNKDEWVINRESSKKYDRELAAINSGTFPKLPGFASGGLFASAAEIKKKLAFLDGTPYGMGWFSPAGVDCSGGVSATVNVGLGRDPFESRMSTVTQGAWLDERGAQPGPGGPSDVSIGWWDRGGGANGHTAMRLQDGTFVESGGNTGGGFTIGRTAGPLTGRGFDQWRHFPTGNGGAQAAASSTADAVEKNASGGASSRIDFGSAEGLISKWEESEKRRQRRAKLWAGVFDTGGVLPPGGVAVNLSGKPEIVVNNAQLKTFDKLADSLGGLNKTLARQVDVTAARPGPGANIGAFLAGSTGKEIFDVLAGSPFGELFSWASPAVNAFGEMEEAWIQQADAANALKQAESQLAAARQNGDAEAIKTAEDDLATARGVVAEAAKAAGVAELNLAFAIIDVIGSIFSKIGEAVYKAKVGLGKAVAESASWVYEWTKMVDAQRETVSKLQQQFVNDKIAYTKSVWETRLAQSDLTKAQLEGVKSVAEAEKKLQAERKRQARLASRDWRDLSTAYGRYRWVEKLGMAERLSDAIRITPEILALEHEVNAAKLSALAKQYKASLAALEASHAQQMAALNLAQSQLQLAQQSAQLAQMQQQYMGMDQTQAMYGNTTAKLYAERQAAAGRANKGFFGWIGSFFKDPIGTLQYAFGGGRAADKQYAQWIDQEIAKREAEGKGLNQEVDPQTMALVQKLFAQGLDQQAMNILKISSVGAPARALEAAKEDHAALAIKQQEQMLIDSQKRLEALIAFESKAQPLREQISAFESGAEYHQYSADAIREESPAVKAALQALADFSKQTALDYTASAAAGGSGKIAPIVIQLPQQDMFTREQLLALLNQFGKIDGLETRIEELEATPRKSATDIMAATVS